MVNRITQDKQIRILNMLVEGSSMRSITRIENCGINTVKRLVVTAGKACIDYHDQHVREVPAQVVQCDEIWAFLYAKRKNVEQAMAAPDEAGDVSTWTAIDSDTKLLISWAVSTSRDRGDGPGFDGRPAGADGKPIPANDGRVECVPRSRRRCFWRQRGLRAVDQNLRGRPA